MQIGFDSVSWLQPSIHFHVMKIESYILLTRKFIWLLIWYQKFVIWSFYSYEENNFPILFRCTAHFATTVVDSRKTLKNGEYWPGENHYLGGVLIHRNTIQYHLFKRYICISTRLSNYYVKIEYLQQRFI